MIAASVSSTELPCSSAPTTTPVIRVSSRLTTNAGASWTSTGVLPRLRVVSYAVASGFVGRVRRADELDERHERDGVEEVHADVGAHLRHGQRRRVRREHAVRPHDLAKLGEHPLLHVHLLDHRL